MTDHDNSQGEPTMEEILASIRRIISEDNDESEDSASANREAAGADSAREHKEPTAPQEEAEVLELSPSQMVKDEKVEPAAEPKPNGLDTAAPSAAGAPAYEPVRAFEAPRSEPKAAMAAQDSVKAAEAEDISKEVEETLLSPEVATAAAAAFGALSKNVTVSGAEGTKSLEELVKEMMKPMLKEWLEDNLPPLVEEVVEREVRRLSHRRVRR